MNLRTAGGRIATSRSLMRDAEFKTWVQELVRAEFHEMEEAAQVQKQYFSFDVREPIVG